MSDFYIANPHELRGKPKATIADYVEQNGILVPKRFATFDEALRYGLPIIARSEHTQDYDGASGLLKSPVIAPEQGITDEGVKKEILKGERWRKYCALFGIGELQFETSVSVSYWEKIPGYNIGIIADLLIRNA